MTDLHIEENVALTHNNTFGIAAYARRLWRITHDAQLAALAKLPPEQAQALLAQGFVVLGGGSNFVLTGDVQPLVLKMETRGMALVDENSTHWIVQAAAGETWHDLVTWTLQQGYPGLENLALIPGSVGAAPVQNIGAYGLELQDRFHSLDAVEIATGDALMSAGRFLAEHGWRPNMPREKQMAVLYRYNHSHSYTRTIMAVADRLRD